MIGDLHEIVPAISAELGRRGAHSLAVAAVALAAALAVSGTLFARRALFLAGLVRRGAAGTRSATCRAACATRRSIVLGQRKLLQRLVPGLMHAFIFWGFLVLFPTIVIAMIGIVDRHATLPWLGHQGWYALLVDVFCVLVLVGVVTALWIRKVAAAAALRGQPPRRGRPDPGADRDDRDHAAAVARVADRARAERLARVVVAGLERALAPVRRTGDAACSSACSSGRTC